MIGGDIISSSPFTKIFYGSCRKIAVFIFSVLSLTIISGILMYFIEGETGGFTSPSLSIYWAIATLLTVGYGDVVLQTSVGRAMASFVSVLGLSIIVVPIFIVIAEIFGLLSRTFSW
ncbi:TPA: voltage-dependent potassium channel [Methanosarcina acetivorans]|uniref:Voltage-dependent potassium channel n=1 Tax=Methanosarcina acetivorans TaxID=2214 RepID=A0A832W9Y5_9EURY|nr:voltage-dependent potassium channel [Methanosarcina acetivorans]